MGIIRLKEATGEFFSDLQKLHEKKAMDPNEWLLAYGLSAAQSYILAQIDKKNEATKGGEDLYSSLSYTLSDAQRAKAQLENAIGYATAPASTSPPSFQFSEKKPAAQVENRELIDSNKLRVSPFCGHFGSTR